MLSLNEGTLLIGNNQGKSRWFVGMLAGSEYLPAVWTDIFIFYSYKISFSFC